MLGRGNPNAKTKTLASGSRFRQGDSTPGDTINLRRSAIPTPALQLLQTHPGPGGRCSVDGRTPPPPATSPGSPTSPVRSSSGLVKRSTLSLQVRGSSSSSSSDSSDSSSAVSGGVKLRSTSGFGRLVGWTFFGSRTCGRNRFDHTDISYSPGLQAHLLRRWDRGGWLWGSNHLLRIWLEP